MIDEVASQLNAIYLEYVATHPDFSGAVSLFAHSLGSVLCFDLLSHQHLASPAAAASPSAAAASSPPAAAAASASAEDASGGSAAASSEAKKS